METLLAAWALHVVVAVLYGIVGIKLARRAAPSASAVAQRGFALFWLALMGLEAVAALRSGLYIGDLLTVPMFNVLAQLDVLLLAAGVWGLLAYLLFLYTGSVRPLGPLTITYVVLFIGAQLLVLSAAPVEAITDDGWGVERTPETGHPTWLGLLFRILLTGPPLVAAVAFLGLYPRVDDRTQKYRVALVGGSILVWFASVLLVGLPDMLAADPGAWQWGGRLLGLVAAIAVLAAYLPPRWLQARGIRRLERDA